MLCHGASRITDSMVFERKAWIASHLRIWSVMIRNPGLLVWSTSSQLVLRDESWKETKQIAE